MSRSSRSRRRRPRKRKGNSKKIILIVALFAIIAAIVVVYGMLGNNTVSKTQVLLETSMGDITIELRDDMPITTGNFINLIQQGVYDNTIFHRVKEDFMIQGGDPTGTGIGDPSIPNIVDEFSDNPENNKNKRGTIAMANKGADYPNSGSSQFFINVVDNIHLDGLHPVFGDVIDGMDVADVISLVDTDGDPEDGGNNKPLEDVVLIRATIIE